MPGRREQHINSNTEVEGKNEWPSELANQNVNTSSERRQSHDSSRPKMYYILIVTLAASGTARSARTSQPSEKECGRAMGFVDPISLFFSNDTTCEALKSVKVIFLWFER